MCNPEKTETENAINRKLNALRAAVTIIIANGSYPGWPLTDLGEAWKEKDEPQ